MCEQSIIGARASVMVYDDNQKKWVPSGSSSGLSKVQIYHHQQNNTFRVVGRKLQDHEVVINCSIVKGLKYNQATATFHQWRDSKFVYGLNFSSQQDAEAFSRAMQHALEVLSGRITQPPITPLPNNSSTYEEDMGYRTMTREDAAIIQQQQIISSAPNDTPTTPISHSNANVQQNSPLPQGHHRTSSAPPAPQPPPVPGFAANTNVLHTQPQFYPNQQMEPQNLVPQQVYMQQGSVPSNQNISQYSQPNVTSNLNQTMDQQSHATNGSIYISSNQILQTSLNNNGVYSSQQHTSPSAPPFAPSVNAPASNSYPPQPPVAPPPPPNFGNMTGGGSVGGGSSGVGLASGGIIPPAPLKNVAQSPQPPPSSRNTGGPPPPPPPPMGMFTNKSDGMDMSSLASQLQQAKLKRSTKNSPPNPPVENSGSSTSSGGSGGYGTIGRPKMASMMDEMAKTLARRRAQADKNLEPDSLEDNGRRHSEKANTLPHKSTTASASSNSASSSSSNANANNTSESPRPIRKRFGSVSEDTIFKQIDGGEGLVLTNNQDLINFKAEIIREIQIEINKAKQEIIEAFKIEFNRR